MTYYIKKNPANSSVVVMEDGKIKGVVPDIKQAEILVGILIAMASQLTTTQPL